MACSHPDTLDTWELRKENVQPVRTGRDVNCISTVLEPSQDDMKRLMHEKQQFEEELIACENHDDPLDPWDRYLKWTIQYFPSSGNNTKIYNLLKKLIARFLSSERYRNDLRYVNAWTRLAEMCDDPLDTFSYMNTQNIGAGCAQFFIAWANEYEKYGDFRKANRIYEDGSKMCAQPADLLQQTHMEFQLRFARATLFKSSEDNEADNVDDDEDKILQDRTVLGGLKGRGKHHVVGTQRTGRVTRACKQPIGQDVIPSTQKQAGSSKFEIFQDTNQEVSVMGEKGQWVTAPSNQDQSKENIQKAGKWKGVKIKQQYKHSELPAIQRTNFSFYEDDLSASNLAQSRQVASNVESVLAVRKKDSEIRSLNSVIGDKPEQSSIAVRMYASDKVYSMMGEMQFEEIRAAFWRHCKNKEKEEIELRERQERLKDCENKIVEQMTKFSGRNAKMMQIWQEKVQQLEESLAVLQLQMKSFKSGDVERIRMQEEADITIQLNSLKQKIQSNAFHLENQLQSVESGFSHEKNLDNKPAGGPLSQSQSSLNGSLRRSGNNSLNISKLSQPSPTINTKEAMDEIYKMFGDPLHDDDDDDPGILEHNQASSLKPVQDARPTMQQPTFPTSEIKGHCGDNSGGFFIYVDENNAERPRVKSSNVSRKGLKELPLPCVEKESRSGVEQYSQNEGCKPTDENKTGCFFDDVTVAQSQSRAQMASTPFCGRSEKLHDIPNVSCIRTESSELEDNKSIINPILLGKDPPAYETLFNSKKPDLKQGQNLDAENTESVFTEEPNQLSVILEASNESEKSSALGSTKSTSSVCDMEKWNTLTQPTSSAANSMITSLPAADNNFNGINFNIGRHRDNNLVNTRIDLDLWMSEDDEMPAIQREAAELPEQPEPRSFALISDKALNKSLADGNHVCEENEMVSVLEKGMD